MGPQFKTIEDFAFRSDATLLDIRGGRSLSSKNKDLTEPGELLLLDPAGRLVVRSEMDDMEEYRETLGSLDEGGDLREREQESRDEGPFQDDKGPPRRQSSRNMR